MNGDRRDADLNFMSVAGVAEGVRSGTLCPVAYVEHLLARIKEVDPHVGAFTVLCRDEALAAARDIAAAVRDGRALGPLGGVPVAVKDNMDVAGLPTTCQSRALAGAPPAARDAEVVARLRLAGAIVLGKLAMEEFAVGDQPPDGPGPVTRNPWDVRRTSGGSSNGSGAAVAAGLVPAALGTDTGGSVRNPAATCGVVGMKPTFGRLPVGGVFPLAPSMDHIGILTRNVVDNALVLAALGVDLGTPDPRAVTGMRVGLLRHFYTRDLPASREVVEAVEAAADVLRGLGATVVEVEVAPLREFRACGDAILAAESHAVHRDRLAVRPGDYSPLTRRLLQAGASLDDAALDDALRRREVLRVGLTEVMEDLNLLVTAVSPATACRLDDPKGIEASSNGSMRLPFNVTGNPAMALPIGFDRGGLPLSLQLVGKPLGEKAMYAAAAAYEAATAHMSRRPALVQDP